MGQPYSRAKSVCHRREIAQNRLLIEIGTRAALEVRSAPAVHNYGTLEAPSPHGERSFSSDFPKNRVCKMCAAIRMSLEEARIKQRFGYGFTLHTGKVQGSIPCAPTIFDLRFVLFVLQPVRSREAMFRMHVVTSRKLIVLTTSLAGGAIGLFAPIGVVRWLLQTEPEDAGILTLFFVPVWCVVFASGLLIGAGWGCSSPAASGFCKNSGRRSGAEGKGVRLNPENPDRHDGPEHREAGNRPARHIARAVGLRRIHHRIVPVGHDGLLKIASDE